MAVRVDNFLDFMNDSFVVAHETATIALNKYEMEILREAVLDDEERKVLRRLVKEVLGSINCKESAIVWWRLQLLKDGTSQNG